MDKAKNQIASGIFNSERKKGMSYDKSKNETQLWNDFRNGKDSSFIKIYEIFFPILYRYGHQFTSDTELIKDTIQDFFITIRNRRGSLGSTNSVRAYFFKSMRRKLIRELSKKRYLFYNPNLEKAFDFEISISSESRLINAQIQLERKMKLQKAFDKLTKRQKEAIIYFYYEGLNYEDIAEIMELSKIKYARTLIYRSLERLREEMDQKII